MRHESISNCGPGCTHSPRPKPKPRGYTLRLLGFVLLGILLLPAYVCAIPLAWPYAITKGLLDWYIAQGKRHGL